MSEHCLGDRERGRTPISAMELIAFAEYWGADPIELWAELLRQADLLRWEPVAEKLDCTVAMAQQRFRRAQKERGLDFAKLWMLVKSEQVQI